MGNKRKSLRFGLMINSLTVEHWQYETIKLLMDNGMKLSLIIQKTENTTVPSFIQKIKDYPFRRLFFRLWNRFLFKPRSKFPADLTELTTDIHTIFCKPKIKGISTYFEEVDIQEIRNQNLDFILRFGFDIVRGEVLNAAKYGVWSFHHDDERIIRGGPPGFWEFMKKIPSNGVILQRLTNSLDKGIILKRIQFKTILHSYKAHLDQLYFGGEVLPLQVCKELIDNGVLEESPSESDAPIVYPPTNLKMIQYYWKLMWRRVGFHLNDLFRQEDWNVGYCESSMEDFINNTDKEQLNIQWFKKPRKNCYFADPFIIKTKKDTYIFFEWYSYPKGKADLAVALKSEYFKKYHKLTNFKEHRSYPYIFEYEGYIYCLPEANQTKQVVLYRFDEEKLTLEKESVLLEGFPIVDATLHHHNGKWFMFLVNQKNSHTHLDIYYSENLRGPYKSHELNPVMIDCSKARPAGKIFSFEGKTIRPSQNCTEHYGQSITLEEIDLLTEKQFKTKEFGRILPINNSDYDKGIHTINSDDNIVVFDGKRFVFTFSGFKQQLKQKIHK
jgi:hypothetical protein